ncbi:MAG: LytR/AlgR family response regulator transcription factor [Rhizomicrobium sp.]
MKLKVLIVDDMPLSRQRTRRLLAVEPELEIVGECGDADSARQAICALRPNLLLLDVQMPGDTGLMLLKGLPEASRPLVIFVTAFDEFAVDAFAVQAVDYLLKPFGRERLAQALAKARERLGRDLGPRRGGYLDRIAVKSVGRTVFVSAADIDWIETAGNYLCLHSGAHSELVRETMNGLEAQLDPQQFLRIHRSTMVRITAIKEIQPLFNGDQSIILRDGTKLVLSRSYREKAKTALGLS